MHHLACQQTAGLRVRDPPPGHSRALSSSRGDQQQLSATSRRSRSASVSQEEEEDVEVPEVGWLWQAGKRGQGSSPAKAAVANLKANRIRAKKCVSWLLSGKQRHSRSL
jgi:hypothetical protein